MNPSHSLIRKTKHTHTHTHAHTHRGCDRRSDPLFSGLRGLRGDHGRPEPGAGNGLIGCDVIGCMHDMRAEFSGSKTLHGTLLQSDWLCMRAASKYRDSLARMRLQYSTLATDRLGGSPHPGFGNHVLAACGGWLRRRYFAW